MKHSSAILLFLVSLLAFSCSDTMSDLGVGIQPTSDAIKVGADTFNLSTSNFRIDSIISRPDSFLLGKFYDEKTESYVQADILAQFEGPGSKGYSYETGAIPDSTILYLGYNTWFGDKYAPLNISVYEMNDTLTYSHLYYTNILLDNYCDKSKESFLGKAVMTVKDASESGRDTVSVKIPLSKEFSDNLFNKTKNIITQDQLSKIFKGLYITSDFGSSSMLNVSSIMMKQYYHYTYTTKSSTNADSTVVVTVPVRYTANGWVRQVNRIMYPDQKKVEQKLAQDQETNYIASPSNFQTKITLPLVSIKKKMDVSIPEMRKTINSALVKVEVTDLDSSSTYPLPVVKYMLLIKESSFDRFFKKKELPNDTCAVLAAYTTAEIDDTGTYEHYYKFSITSLVAHELNNKKANNYASLTDETLRLVPVDVTYNSSGTVTSVKQANQLSAVRIRSGKNKISPMKLSLVYSGFWENPIGK